MMEATLPILTNSVEHMNQGELEAFIQRMLQMEAGQKPMTAGNKPAWWPGDVPFSSFNTRNTNNMQVITQEMRDIVRNCYQFYGQEDLLKGVARGDGTIKVVNNQDGSLSFITDQTVVTLEHRQNTPYAICPSNLEAATPGRSSSASTGILPSPITGLQPGPMPTGLFKNNNHTVTTDDTVVPGPAVKPFPCNYCGKTFTQKFALTKHLKFDCSVCPTKIDSRNYQTRHGAKITVRPYERVRVIPRKPRKLIEEKVTFPPKGTYIERMGLLPLAKAERVRRQSIGNKKIDCDVLELDEKKKPKTPTTPRTPKSLMSQLSRDASPPVRTRLCMAPPDERGEHPEIKEESSDSESECSKSDNGEERFRPRRIAPLLNIALTSNLGDRVRKHICAFFADKNEEESSDDEENDEEKFNKYENYCKTPTKSKDIGRLRSRGNEVQVTFKKTKRTASKWTHKYKFRRSTLKEFCRVVETGLNRRSRALKRLVKPCKVVLRRVNSAEIDRWTKPKPYLSPQKVADIRRWMYGSAGMSDNYLRSLLVQPVKPYSKVQEQTFRRTMMHHQQPNPAMANSAVLTPPSTPEAVRMDDDVICLDYISSPEASKPTTTQPSYTMATTPQKQRRKQPLTPRKWVDDGDTKTDDVISISSTESDAELKVISPESLKRAANFSPVTGEMPTKCRKIEELRPAALLFRCHLCFEEITCHDGASVYIKAHFARSHNVHNIDLIEHLDASGQKVVSIVEVPTPQKQPPAANPGAPKPSGEAVKTKLFANSGSTKPAAKKQTVLKGGKQQVKNTSSKPATSKPTQKQPPKKVAPTKVTKQQPKAKPQAKPPPSRGMPQTTKSKQELALSRRHLFSDKPQKSPPPAKPAAGKKTSPKAATSPKKVTTKPATKESSSRPMSPRLQAGFLKTRGLRIQMKEKKS